MTTEQIKQKGESILSLIANIKRLREEQDTLLRQLEKQALLMRQGIDVEQIIAYGYDPKLDKRKGYGYGYGYGYEVGYNVVYMKDGTKVPIESMEM